MYSGVAQKVTIFAAKDAKNNFGRLLDAAQRQPITIQKKGRNVAVVLAYDIYEHLCELDDAYWAERAQLAQKKGVMLSPDESDMVLKKFIHATDTA